MKGLKRDWVDGVNLSCGLTGAEAGLVNAASGCISPQFGSTALIRSVLSGLEINVRRRYGRAATT